MRIVITGASGFIGTALVEALLSRRMLTGPNGEQAALKKLVLVDVYEPRSVPGVGGADIEFRRGDICDAALRKEIFGQRVDVIFHLAATLTAEAQADPSKGTRVNVRGLLDLLEECRSQEAPPRFVFTSSIATFGGALPEVVDDDVVQKPQTSYGSHKVIAEQLINDYSRHGVIDGRALRLPIVLVRPPSVTPSVSDQVAAIVREPLAGRDFICPFKADTKLAVVSVQRVAEALLTMMQAPAALFTETRALNLPALTVTPAEMVRAVKNIAGGRPLGRVEYFPDPQAQKIVDSWPKYFVSKLASRAGLSADASFEAIVKAYLQAAGEE
ncbi:MAG TPA: NAD-dependent epimerase/dehydratase family protein [Gammaproteobacteria bacterium]|nr:NAD-dependent epimerase/dehydratase family protein [Gammaproteobacteria bacterium]